MNAIHINVSRLHTQMVNSKTLKPDVVYDLFGTKDPVDGRLQMESISLTLVIFFAILFGGIIANNYYKDKLIMQGIMVLMGAMACIYFTTALITYCKDTATNGASIFVSKDSMLSQHGNGTNLDYYCNLGCKCKANVKFSPVCTKEGRRSYFSPCHAGCTSFNRTIKVKYIINSISADNHLEVILNYKSLIR